MDQSIVSQREINVDTESYVTAPFGRILLPARKDI